ncbi:MAG: hypothetical protein JCHSAcid_15160 [uncultured Acidilobus sp. JCHS]|nr:MAG: hypothetical protein JCHSAcid_15160 [uncultured Acidilobus sp. JCHS]
MEFDLQGLRQPLQDDMDGESAGWTTLYMVGSSLLYLFVRGLTCMAGPRLLFTKSYLAGLPTPRRKGRSRHRRYLLEEGLNTT